MRIRDWSSDVCSSDLIYGFGGLAGLLSSNESGLGMHCDIVVAANPDNDGIAYLGGGNVLDGVTMRLLRLTPGGQFADLPMRSPGAQIGRESCRARVCQYV